MMRTPPCRSSPFPLPQPCRTLLYALSSLILLRDDDGCFFVQMICARRSAFHAAACSRRFRCAAATAPICSPSTSAPSASHELNFGGQSSLLSPTSPHGLLDELALQAPSLLMEQASANLSSCASNVPAMPMQAKPVQLEPELIDSKERPVCEPIDMILDATSKIAAVEVRRGPLFGTSCGILFGVIRTSDLEIIWQVKHVCILLHGIWSVHLYTI